VVLLFTTILSFGQVSPAARKLHASALVFDGHVHVIDRQFYLGGDIGDRFENGHFDLPRAREGGLGAMFFSIFVPEAYYPQRMETRQTFRLVDLALTQLAKNRATIELARNADELERIRKSGRIAAVLDLEGGFDLDGDLGILRDLYRLGMRSLQLPAHNWPNNFADSCCAPHKWNGLNERGRAVVCEMNRLGMVINVSHGSDETIEQAIDVSSDPVVATHYGLREFNDIPRNMPTPLLRKLAAKGGVIGFQIGGNFHLRSLFEARTRRAGKAFWDTSGVQARDLSIYEIDKLVAPGFPMVAKPVPEDEAYTLDDYLKVVERAIGIAGEDHVALGTDFDGGPPLPRGMRDIRDLPMITDATLRRGWSEQRIRKFMGENLLRVFRQVTGKPGGSGGLTIE
jgi:membrane dipeptidase